MEIDKTGSGAPVRRIGDSTDPLEAPLVSVGSEPVCEKTEESNG